jgi:ABC-type spermidine/putrescine transport system permease subunit I
MGPVQGGMRSLAGPLRRAGRKLLLATPLLFLAAFLIVPLGFTAVVSFWERVGLRMRPALSLASYGAFFSGVRLGVLERTLVIAAETTLLSLLIAYPIAYFLALRAGRKTARIVLLLFTVPFLVNYIIRTFSWSFLLSRTGPVNELLIASGLTGAPLDWLLYSDFAVIVGLVTSYMPFMVFPLFLSLAAVDRSLIQASWLLGAGPVRTFLRVTLPLSLPGIFAAVIFGFVGSFGESAVPVILGGTGYQLIGNEITSTLDVLNYPLAAAISTVVVAIMLLLMGAWYAAFDLRSIMGKMLRWRF